MARCKTDNGPRTKAARTGAAAAGKRRAPAGTDFTLGHPAVLALAAIDGDCMDESADIVTAKRLGVDIEDLVRIRALHGYEALVRDECRRFFRIRDRKAVWAAYVEKAKAGDSRICERLLEETGGWLSPAAARKGTGGGQEKPEIRVVIRSHLDDMRTDGDRGENGEAIVRAC